MPPITENKCFRVSCRRIPRMYRRWRSRWDYGACWRNQWPTERQANFLHFRLPVHDPNRRMKAIFLLFQSIDRRRRVWSMAQEDTANSVSPRAIRLFDLGRQRLESKTEGKQRRHCWPSALSQTFEFKIQVCKSLSELREEATGSRNVGARRVTASSRSLKPSSKT